MHIVTANISGFRNLVDLEISFSPRVNLFVGRNGQGKTNLLEALNYLALGRSHRGARGEDLIAFAADHLHVAVDLHRETTTENTRLTRAEYGLARGGGRRIRVDGQPIQRRAALIGNLAAVFFSPESIQLVRGSPEVRRRHVDQGRAGIAAESTAQLLAFNRAMRQKARLLRDEKLGLRPRGGAREEISAWNRELAGYAAAVCLGRQWYASEIAAPLATAYNRLADTDEKLVLNYRANLQTPLARAQNSDLEGEIRQEFDYIRDEEIRRGRPLIGPQLDDFEVRLGDRDLRTFGSQGETPTAAIALILAQRDLLYQSLRIRPVLFFDDIFSELDRQRAQRLQELTVEDHQVFVATARWDDIADWRPARARIWTVDSGKVTEHDDAKQQG